MTFRPACTVSEIDPGSAISVDLGLDVETAIVRTLDDQVFAIWNECSHGMYALSEGEIDGCTLECFAHGSRFDLRTGTPLELPATRPVPVYPVRIDGDTVLVDIDNPINQEN